MSQFEERLRLAAQRGEARGQSREEIEEAEKARNDSLRSLHTKYRLQISDKIEPVVKKLCDQFPGFQYSTVFGQAGWGASCTRDDLRIVSGTRQTLYSRFEMVVRPVNDFFVLDLHAKGTVGNREVLVRNCYQPIQEIDVPNFEKLVEDWTISFAELYAAN